MVQTGVTGTWPVDGVPTGAMQVSTGLTDQDEVRPVGLVGPARLGLDFDRVAGVLDARGVDQLDGQAVALAEGGQVVAGGSGQGGNDGMVLARAGH